MSGFAVRGWCPNAWRPMAAGDGLLVRVKPRLARLTCLQLRGLCEASLAHGNGLIDLTNRGNLQLRGVSDATWPLLIERLIALGLVDADPDMEQRRTLLVTPDWREGDDTHRIASDLLALLHALPELPGKMGFAIDAGPAPLLAEAPGDFRIERSGDGALILRLEGRPAGTPLRFGDEADALVRLAHWFVESGGVASGRAARHAAPLPEWAPAQSPPATAAIPLRPGPHPLGAALGVAFGQLDARQFLGGGTDDLRAVRVTPWRVLLIEGAAPVDPALITDPEDPLLRTDACVGAPACPQASVETRTLAARLAPRVAGRLHVSGCAKGCGRARTADVVVTGRDGLLDLAFNARAGAAPVHAGRSPDALLSLFGTD
ncbi:cobalamin biosynthesis protein CobG [Sphingomonas sp.]|uniref:cobalamin biosynthesis protein CobG n=1 Tax=Sphingomonas sp. TaxID=28214 RepID=UPI002FDB084C